MRLLPSKLDSERVLHEAEQRAAGTLLVEPQAQWKGRSPPAASPKSVVSVLNLSLGQCNNTSGRYTSRFNCIKGHNWLLEGKCEMCIILIFLHRLFYSECFKRFVSSHESSVVASQNHPPRSSVTSTRSDLVLHVKIINGNSLWVSRPKKKNINIV